MSDIAPGRYLTVADQMLRGTGPVGAAAAAGWWPKACACLIRLALEAGLQAYWERVSPPVADCTAGRTRLLLLRRRTTREVAGRIAYAWATLSRATHHHCYEAAPTAAELRRLHREVATLLSLLTPAGTDENTPPPERTVDG